MVRKVTEVKNCIKTFEGDGIPVTRGFPVLGMREFDPLGQLIMNQEGQLEYLLTHIVALKLLHIYWMEKWSIKILGEVKLSSKLETFNG